MLGTEPRTSHMRGKSSTTELYQLSFILNYTLNLSSGMRQRVLLKAALVTVLSSGLFLALTAKHLYQSEGCKRLFPACLGNQWSDRIAEALAWSLVRYCLASYL